MFLNFTDTFLLNLPTASYILRLLVAMQTADDLFLRFTEKWATSVAFRKVTEQVKGSLISLLRPSAPTAPFLCYSKEAWMTLLVSMIQNPL